jgi:hypothetical protein
VTELTGRVVIVPNAHTEAGAAVARDEERAARAEMVSELFPT